jgi:capsular exopolysaccharide synthesis family protein
VELRDYIRTFRRRWKVIFAGLVVVVGISALATVTATPMYESSARLFISTSPTTESDAYQGGLFSAQRVTSYADLVNSSGQLAGTVIADQDLDLDPGELLGKVEATVIPETVVLEVSVRDPDPERAQRLAQAYADALTDLVRELETPAGSTTPLLKATTVDAASEPTSPVSPDPVRNLVLGFILGLLLGVGLALLREFLDASVKSGEDVAAITEAPLLGAISFDNTVRSRPLVTELDSHAPRVEAFRVLRTSLQYVDVDSPSKVFVITSSLPGEGKTTTAVNLAITLAQAGHRTLLVEGDLRRPRAALALGLDQSVGVTTVLLGHTMAAEAIQKHHESDLHVLASGPIPPNPAELAQSNMMSEMLVGLREAYEIVLIDAPPLLPVTDAALLTAQADGALLVVRYGKTTKDQLAQAVERLQQVDASPLGTVLNMVPTRNRGPGGYGGYGYGYSPDQPSVVEGRRRSTVMSSTRRPRSKRRTTSRPSE